MKRNVSVMQNVGVVHTALLLLVLLLAQSVAAQVGAIYYVSTTGNDSNPGTFAQPWLTIQHAANTATAGATVNVMGGVYNAYVSFPNSGTASEPIIFQSYPILVGTTIQPAVIDGTGLTVSGTQGLITISGARSYITVNGFEIRNLTATTKSAVPCGVWITGSGTGVQILNNQIHNIVTTSEKSGNGCGLFAYGTSQTPITQLVVSGNELYNLKTGNSESFTFNGNVTHFQITNNIIHDNDNIGIDIIGYEGTGPVGYDQASYGIVSGNTVYNISGIANVGEGTSYDADGLYCDGCAWITFEHNAVFQVDYGIETTSENQVCQATGTEWTGAYGVGTPAKAKLPCYGMYATVRNNLFYYENACGNSIGGYGLATTKGGGSNGGGSSFHDVFVNNTLFDNGTQPGNDSEGTPSGDFQIQYQVGTSQDDYFENNVIYESAASPYSTSPNMWINSFVPANQAYPATLTAAGLTYPAPPATLNWNLYGSAAGYLEGTSILWSDVSSYTDFLNYQTTNVGGEDANSVNADPLFAGLGAYPPNAYTSPGSPTVGAGSTSLSCSVGWCDPNGSSPTSIYGSTDFLGNPRTSGSNIDIGAYENTGVLTENSMEVNLSSAASGLNGGESTTLMVTVTAIPGGGGAPSGTVSIMDGATLLETATLMPTGVNSTAVTLPLSASQLAQGNNTLTAVYSGNSVLPCCNPSNPPGGSQTPVPWYPSATSSSISVTETPTTSQTVTFTTPPPASAAYGSSFTVAATASSGLAVTFTSSGSCSNSGATYTMTASSGTCSVTANQAGNSVFLAATPVTDSTNATQAATSINVSVSPASEDFALDAPVTITAVLSWSGSGSAPTASAVTIDGNGPSSYGTTSCGAASGNTMTCTNTYTPTTADTPASYTETAVFSGDGNYSGSGSPQTNDFTINQATSSTAVTSTPNPSTYATSVTFTATITGENGDVKGQKAGKSGMKPMQLSGTVTWSANTGCSPSSVSGDYPAIATCTTSRASSLPVGTDVVTATYSGDGDHNSSVGSVNQVVNGGIATTIDVTSVSPSSEEFAADTPATITAVLSWVGNGVAPTAANVTISGNGSGTYSATSCAARVHETITCTATYTPTNADVAGTYTEKASFSGDTNYTASSSPETNNFTIGSNLSTTSVSSSGPSTYGQSVTFTATVTSDTGDVKGRKAGKNGIRPMQLSGTVTWSADTGCAPTTLSGTLYPDGATCTTSSLAAGNYTVTATYSGDSNHSGSSGSVSQTVNQASQTINVTTPAPPQVVKGSSFTVVASATSGLPVSFATSGACTNSGGTITMSNTASGTCNINITQAGNSNYTAAPPVPETTTIAAAIAPAVTFTGAPTSSPYQSTFTVSATTNASTTAVITATPATVCTISGNTVTMISGTGTCMMKASWAADDVYKAATATQTTKAAKITPTVTFTGAPSTAAYQSTFTVPATTNASTTAAITATPASVCTISSGTVTMASGTGTCTTTAKWAADANYLAATLTQTTTAQELTSTVSWTAPSPITYGTTLSGVLDAVGSVAGKYAYTANGNAVTATTVLPAGSYTMGVTFTPTASKDYTSSTASVSLTVNPINTTTTITKVIAPKATPLAITVSITVANGLTATHDATGSVTVTASSGETCTATLASGKGSCVLTTAVAESGTVTAAYAGDSNNNGSTSAAVSFTD